MNTRSPACEEVGRKAPSKLAGKRERSVTPQRIVHGPRRVEGPHTLEQGLMMTDQEAIEIAERYGLPVVHIPPRGVIDEVVTVDLRGPRPIVTRRPPPTIYPNLRT